MVLCLVVCYTLGMGNDKRFGDKKVPREFARRERKWEAAEKRAGMDRYAIEDSSEDVVFCSGCKLSYPPRSVGSDGWCVDCSQEFMYE